MLIVMSMINYGLIKYSIEKITDDKTEKNKAMHNYRNIYVNVSHLLSR